MERRRGGAAGVGPNAAPCAGREPRQAVGGARRRPLQNSQRVLLAAKPRTAAASRHGRCEAAGPAAERGEGRPSIAPHRNGTAWQWGRAWCTRAVYGNGARG